MCEFPAQARGRLSGQGGQDGLFGGEVIKERARGYPGGIGNTARGASIEAVAREQLPGGFKNSLPRRGLGFGSHPHGTPPLYERAHIVSASQTASSGK